VLGQRSHDLLGRLLPRSESEFEAELRAKFRFTGELIHTGRGGRRITVLANLLLTRGGDGVARVYETNRDVTARKEEEDRIRRSEARLRLLSSTAARLLAAPDPQAVVDALCREVMEHLDCQAFFNFVVDAAAGKLHLNAYSGVSDEAARRIEWLALGETICGCVARDGASIVVEDVQCSGDPRAGLVRSFGMKAYCSHPLKGEGGRLMGTLSFGTRTRTRFTLDEIELLRTVADQVATAMDRIESRRSLEAANARLREADRAKDEFLAVLSHELRNPLAPVRNSLAILQRTSLDGEQARRALAVIDRQTAQLSHLVDELLDVTRVTRNKVVLQKTSLGLSELVHRTVEDHRSLFEAKSIVLEAPPGPPDLRVDGDPARLAQVIGNLLQNSAKFTGRGGSVTVTVRGDAVRGRAMVTVRDDGAGIPAGVLSRLFEPFTQADTTLDRSSGGLGLGLALVKGLVELHGGEVSAQSDGPGRGAEFTVELPLPEGVRLEAEPAPAVPATTAKRVLIIEDNVDAADTLRDLLALAGHSAEVAYDGRTGLAKARRFRPEIVLCDIGLPGLDGYAVARALRSDEELSHCTVVALTGYALPEDLQKARAAGFDRHVAKPPSPETLEAILAAPG